MADEGGREALLGWPGVKSVYTRVGKTQGGGQDVPEDVVGVIQYEFVDWRERKSANQILDELRGVMAGIPGVDVEVRVPEAGPPTGKAIQVQAVRRRSGRGSTRRREPSRQRIAQFPASSTFRTACRRPASTGRSRSTAPRRRNIGVNPIVGRDRGPARHQRAEAQRIPAGRRRRRRRHQAAPARGPAHAVDARRVARGDRAGLGADLEFRRAQGGADASASSTASTASARSSCRPTSPAACRWPSCSSRSARQISEMDLGSGMRWKLAGSNEDSEEASAFLSQGVRRGASS